MDLNLVMKDLQIIDKLYPIINNTITNAGSNELKLLLYDFEFIHKRLVFNQNIIKSFLINKSIRNDIIKLLHTYHSLEPSIQWFFDKTSNDDKNVYFESQYLNNKILLNSSNYFKLIMPYVSYLIPIVMFFILKYHYSAPIDLHTFMKESIFSIYYLFKRFAWMLEPSIIKRNFFSSIIYHLTIFYNIYSIYNGVSITYTHSTLLFKYHKLYYDFIDLIDVAFNIYEINKKINYHVFDDINNSFSEIKSFMMNNIQFDIAEILLLKKNHSKIEQLFFEINKFIGLIDCYCNLSLFVESNKFCLPKFEKNHTPFIDAVGIYHPFLLINNSYPIKNDINIKNTIIITGPNASGKSTFMRSIMINIFMAQTIGICSANKFYFTPFAKLNTYLNIPDNIGRESLFEAEMNRCWKLLNTLKNSSEHEFIFTIIDELFTGTNPLEGQQSSIGVCKKFKNYSNSIQMLSTHFHILGSLEKQYPDFYTNKKFSLIEHEDGTFTKPFKIEDGITTQNVALKLLKLKGFDLNLF
jgi:hypothetical protein